MQECFNSTIWHSIKVYTFQFFTRPLKNLNTFFLIIENCIIDIPVRNINMWFVERNRRRNDSEDGSERDMVVIDEMLEKLCVNRRLGAKKNTHSKK